MSNQFPLESDAFSGAARITAQQRSEGRDGAPLFELLNEVARFADGPTAMSGALDLGASASVAAAANRGFFTNTGAARTLTLPAFADVPDGWELTALSLDGTTNSFTVAVAGAETINGVAGDVVLNASHAWVKVMKLPGATGWLAVGGTMIAPA